MSDVREALQRQADAVSPHPDLADVVGRAQRRRRRRMIERASVGVLVLWVLVVGLLAIRHNDPTTHISVTTQPPAPAVVAIALANASINDVPPGGTLDRSDPDALADAWTVTVRRSSDGSLGLHGAVVTFPVSKAVAGKPIDVGPTTGISQVGMILWPIGNGYARVRGDLDQADLLAIAEATTIVAGRPAVTAPAGFTALAPAPYRAPFVHEVRYNSTAIGQAGALGNGLTYTGVTIGGGFEDELYRDGIRATLTVQNRPAVVSAVNGGNGTLAWEPQPGVVAYVGYSGGGLDDSAEQALVTLADASHPLDQAQWDATNPQVVSYPTSSVNDLPLLDGSLQVGCASTPSTHGVRPAGWEAVAGLPTDLPRVESAEGHVLLFSLSSFLEAATGPQNNVQIFTDSPTPGLTITGTLGSHHTTPIVASHPGGATDWFDTVLEADVAGCWRFDITFNGHTDTLYLAFR